MTPDTAALRALVDTYVTGWYLTAAEVRALCDAADAAERLRERLTDATAQIKRMATEHLAAAERAQVEIERLRKAVWASEEIDRRAGMLAGVQAERDASRTAHAALIADLRALHTVKHECSPAVFLLYTDVLSLLDRHAPEEGR